MVWSDQQLKATIFLYLSVVERLGFKCVGRVGLIKDRLSSQGWASRVLPLIFFAIFVTCNFVFVV